MLVIGVVVEVAKLPRSLGILATSTTPRSGAPKQEIGARCSAGRRLDTLRVVVVNRARKELLLSLSGLTLLMDLDGTLVNTPIGIHDVLRDVLQEFGYCDVTTKQIMQTVGLPLDTSIAGLINEPETSRPVSEMVSAYRRQFDAVVLPAAKSLVYEGVVDGLEELTQIGAKLAVATSKVQAGAEKLLHAAGLSQFFTVIVGSDRVARPKPHAGHGSIHTQSSRVHRAGCHHGWRYPS